MDINRYNQKAWDREVQRENPWSRPVDSETIAAAREGKWNVVLTPTRPVPHEWFGDIAGKKILCLASGGGQQAPILAAAGANVTLLDQSPAMLAQDSLVAAREMLDIEIVEGDMAKLSMFKAGSFDLVFHPVSNCFVPDLAPVWKEAHRVLKAKGTLLAGFANPFLYLFDRDEDDPQKQTIVHSLPYSDLEDLDDDRRRDLIAKEEPLEWSHSLDDQIGGQIAAGFVITGFYEDLHPGHPLAEWGPTMIATRAMKGKKGK